MSKTTLGVTKFDCSSLNLEQTKNLVEVDYWDTLEALIKNTYLTLSKEQKSKITRSTYNENTRVAIWTANCLFLGAIEHYEKQLDNSFETKLKLAQLFELYVENRKIVKSKGKKVIKKWVNS